MQLTEVLPSAGAAPVPLDLTALLHSQAPGLSRPLSVPRPEFFFSLPTGRAGALEILGLQLHGVFAWEAYVLKPRRCWDFLAGRQALAALAAWPPPATAAADPVRWAALGWAGGAGGGAGARVEVTAGRAFFDRTAAGRAAGAVGGVAQLDATLQLVGEFDPPRLAALMIVQVLCVLSYPREGSLALSKVPNGHALTLARSRALTITHLHIISLPQSSSSSLPTSTQPLQKKGGDERGAGERERFHMGRGTRRAVSASAAVVSLAGGCANRHCSKLYAAATDSTAKNALMILSGRSQLAGSSGVPENFAAELPLAFEKRARTLEADQECL